ncbi:hypothetical protein PLICRDRAFT_102084 [Plicaturopsis crispa FD-325 SS-3]|nr:hypothetical protein PLICRDRAFT_102084 [Plicaturopsis crispa FD-325 SS-3]
MPLSADEDSSRTAATSGSKLEHQPPDPFLPPPLHTPHNSRKKVFAAALVLVLLDLCILPLTYYYALKFASDLTLQDVFAVITSVYGLISFSHYGIRTLKLFREKTSSRIRPLGWTRWGTLEFLHVNIAIAVTIAEILLIAGTAPKVPITRLCAMPTPAICYYIGLLFVLSAILHQTKSKLPFNMSSTAKGEPWPPAVFTFMEDAVAVEGRGERKYREDLRARYDASPLFRSMLLHVTWLWGLGLLGIAVVSTALVFTLQEDIAFGIGWGLPYAFILLWSLVTIVYVHIALGREKAWWMNSAAKANA